MSATTCLHEQQCLLKCTHTAECESPGVLFPLILTISSPCFGAGPDLCGVRDTNRRCTHTSRSSLSPEIWKAGRWSNSTPPLTEKPNAPCELRPRTTSCGLITCMCTVTRCASCLAHLFFLLADKRQIAERSSLDNRHDCKPRRAGVGVADCNVDFQEILMTGTEGLGVEVMDRKFPQRFNTNTMKSDCQLTIFRRCDLCC